MAPVNGAAARLSTLAEALLSGAVKGGRRLAPVCLAVGALACGETLVDSDYSGTPLFTLQGVVGGPTEVPLESGALVTTAMFWSPQGPTARSYGELVEQLGTASAAPVPRPYVMNLFDEPGPQHLYTTPSGARYALGRVVAYLDTNRNGRLDPSELILGASQGFAVLYAPQELAAEDSPTGRPLRAGWQSFMLPLRCPGSTSGPGPAPVADGDCGVPLGEPCDTDADCNGGVCLAELLIPLPHRMCAIPEPPPNGCRQRGSVLIRRGPGRDAWIQGCESSSDCTRGYPYQCDARLLACFPSAEVQVNLNETSMRPFCVSEPPPP